MRDFKQEFIDTYVRVTSSSNMDASQAAAYLAPTGDENVPALQKTLLFALMEREHFNMKSWVGDFNRVITRENANSCGTTFCLAGAASLFSLKDNEFMLDAAVRLRQPGFEDNYFSPYIEQVSSRGGQVLGLNGDQKSVLFYLPDNVELVTAAMNYLAGRDLVPEGILESTNV